MIDIPIVEKLLKRAKDDRDAAANSAAVFELLKPEFDKFEAREAPWDTYAVRLAVDHRLSAKRDTAYADDLEQSAALLKECVEALEGIERIAEKHTGISGARSLQGAMHAIAHAARATLAAMIKGEE